MCIYSIPWEPCYCFIVTAGEFVYKKASTYLRQHKSVFALVQKVDSECYNIKEVISFSY